MTRSIAKPLIITSWLMGVAFSLPPSALAQQPSPLYVLASQYEAELEAFEDTVTRIRGIDRVDERLVDRLEDASGRLKLAAKNPRHFNRLFHQWQKVQALQRETEQTIFEKYTPHHDLIGQWDRVLAAESLFVQEYVLHIENPSHLNTVRRLDRPSARRENYLIPAISSPR